MYWNILSSTPGSKISLTKFDNEIYEKFTECFPEYHPIENVKGFNENDLSVKEAKSKRSSFFKWIVKEIEDYNFGALLRTDATWEYDQFTTYFVVKLQYYVFEIAKTHLD